MVWKHANNCTMKPVFLLKGQKCNWTVIAKIQRAGPLHARAAPKEVRFFEKCRQVPDSAACS